MDKFLKSELILGGQRSGKSRRAEVLANGWLAESSQHCTTSIASAAAWPRGSQPK